MDNSAHYSIKGAKMLIQTHIPGTSHRISSSWCWGWPSGLKIHQASFFGDLFVEKETLPVQNLQGERENVSVSNAAHISDYMY